MEVFISFYNCHFFFGDENEIGTIFTNDDTPETAPEFEENESEDDSDEEEDDDTEDDWDDDSDEKDESETDRLKRKLFGFLNGKHHCCAP